MKNDKTVAEAETPTLTDIINTNMQERADRRNARIKPDLSDVPVAPEVDPATVQAIDLALTAAKLNPDDGTMRYVKRDTDPDPAIITWGVFDTKTNEFVEHDALAEIDPYEKADA